MKIAVELPDFQELTKDIEGDIAAVVTSTFRETTPDAKADLRTMTVDAGLGAGVANAWRDKVYPESRNSLDPAGHIRSKAPNIVDAFASGTTIVPVNGSRYLAIPTKAVPRSNKRGRPRMSPSEVEAAFNQDMIIRPGVGGKLFGLIDPAKSDRSTRRTGKHELVLMFTFTASVRMPRKLDLDAPAARWATATAAALQGKLG